MCNPFGRSGHTGGMNREGGGAVGTGPNEDRRLVREYLRRRDEAAFRELYRRHSPALYALLSRLCGFDREEAQDALQDTWIRACRGLVDFRWESSLRTWLCGIAVMRLRERRRGRMRRPEETLPAAEPASPGGGSRTDAMDIERAIASLPEKYREVFVLREIEGYTHDEIGTLLKISSGTSKSQLFRARRALREILGAQERDDEPRH